ncbi:hypothetical protein ACX93W_05775 [Paenibacillus sp. CAU 1782]
MNQRVKTTLRTISYSLLAGLFLALFAQMDHFIKYLFSLLALLMGILYFRKVETTVPRVLFIVLALIFYFVAAIIFAAVAFIRDHPDYMTGMLFGALAME